MKLLSKMVNFRTTPERYEQLKKLAEALPWPRTVAQLINRGLELAEKELSLQGLQPDHAPQDITKCVGKKSTRPARSSSKTPGRPAKRKT